MENQKLIILLLTLIAILVGLNLVLGVTGITPSGQSSRLVTIPPGPGDYGDSGTGSPSGGSSGGSSIINAHACNADGICETNLITAENLTVNGNSINYGDPLDCYNKYGTSYGTDQIEVACDVPETEYIQIMGFVTCGNNTVAENVAVGWAPDPSHAANLMRYTCRNISNGSWSAPGIAYAKCCTIKTTSPSTQSQSIQGQITTISIDKNGKVTEAVS